MRCRCVITHDIGSNPVSATMVLKVLDERSR
nr:MAG TPA: hypothetical protein [Caudoviricetes sp.]